MDDAVKETCLTKEPGTQKTLLYRGCGPIAFRPGQPSFLASGREVCDPFQQKHLYTIPSYHFGAAIAFSPDGGLLAVGIHLKAEGVKDPVAELQLWRPNDGRKLVTLMRYQDQIMDIAFSRDGNCLLVAAGHTVQVWDAKNRTLLQELGYHEDVVMATLFHPVTNLIATASGTQIHLWDVRNGRRLQTLDPGIGNSLFAIAFNPQGTMLATGVGSGNKYSIYCWDVHSGKRIGSMSGHESNIRGLVFHPSGRWLVSASDDHTVKIWDVLSGRLVFSLLQSGRVENVVFSSDGEWLAIAVCGKEQCYIKTLDFSTE